MPTVSPGTGTLPATHGRTRGARFASLSRYDREIASGGDDERALRMSTWLVGNHIRSFTEKLIHCDESVHQITGCDASPAPNDPSSS
jgi:hypothetical protein